MIPITTRNRSRLGMDPTLRSAYAPDSQRLAALSGRHAEPSSDRQHHPKAGGLLRPRGDRRFAAMQAGDLPHQREPQSGALGFPAQATEWREYTIALALGDASA